MPQKKTAQKKRASLSAENLKPGVRFKFGAFYGRPSVGVEILRDRESGTAASGLPQDRWWSRNLDTDEEGYVVLGPGGVLNVDEVLDRGESGGPSHAPKKKSPAQLQREIDEVLARHPDTFKDPHTIHAPGRLKEKLVRKLKREKMRVECEGKSRKPRASHATKKISGPRISSARRSHATKSAGKVILANRIKTSASFGEPRHYATLIDQVTGQTVYKSAVKQASHEAAALAETFAKRRHLEIVGRV